MDGTLVETEEYWGEALGALADGTAAGSPQAAAGDRRLQHADVDGGPLPRPRRDPAEDELLADARWVEDTTAELMAGDIPWRPGAAELLRSVRAAAWPRPW